jgi:hypothetical protein
MPRFTFALRKLLASARRVSTSNVLMRDWITSSVGIAPGCDASDGSADLDVDASELRVSALEDWTVVALVVAAMAVAIAASSELLRSGDADLNVGSETVSKLPEVEGDWESAVGGSATDHIFLGILGVLLGRVRGIRLTEMFDWL